MSNLLASRKLALYIRVVLVLLVFVLWKYNVTFVTLIQNDDKYDPTIQRLQALTKELEQSTIRYYVYDHDNVTLFKVRQRAKEKGKPTWKPKWGLRYADYARGEIRWLEALEKHPLRTRNASEADFFVVPIPVGAAIYYGDRVDLIRAFRLILHDSLFQQYPEKHVAAISTTEQIFGERFWGLSKNEMMLFNSSVVVRDSDWPRTRDWHKRRGIEYACNINLSYEEERYFKHWLSLGYGGEGSNPENSYRFVDMETWTNKTFWFFYHVRKKPFLCNSTIFRHTFFAEDDTIDLTLDFKHSPVTIGEDIPKEQWLQEFTNSKFCLAIRGDQPGSRSLNRAVRAGCIPLVVSDSLPTFQRMYSKTLAYDEFALFVTEEEFLKDPVGSMDRVVSLLTPTDLMHKLTGLRLMQRILAVDQPDSLFVPAFAREVTETMKEEPLTQHE